MNKKELQNIIDNLVKDGYHIERKDMPQIKSNLVQDFIDYLKELGINTSKKMIPVNKLKSTQGEINVEKVLPLLDYEKLEQMNKPIIVSNDYYILDGHHRFSAMYALDNTMKMNCFIVDIGIKELLNKAKKFGGTTYKSLTERYGLMSFNEFLNEKLITFGGLAYPNFGQIVILAGGAGSGKGFISSKLMGIEGKVLDVDALKQLALESPMIIDKAKKLGVDLESLNLKNPDDVSMIHTVLSDRLGITDKHKETLFQSIALIPKERKPNLIFDVTLKDTKKFREIIDYAKMLGYNPENIHLVWVINDINIAKMQNKERDRVVPEDILTLTHVGAAQTIKDLLDNSTDLQNKLDGDIIFAFNKVDPNSDWVKTDKERISQRVNPDSTVLKSDKGGSYIKDANYIYVKKKGKPVLKSKELGSLVLKKIFDYTPSEKTWRDLFDS